GTASWICVRPSLRTSANSFFFSSRRRHTRSKRDWSSDVYSSDLGAAFSTPLIERGHDLHRTAVEETREATAFLRVEDHRFRAERSEERRVGKESRSRCVRPN